MYPLLRLLALGLGKVFASGDGSAQPASPDHGSAVSSRPKDPTVKIPWAFLLSLAFLMGVSLLFSDSDDVKALGFVLAFLVVPVLAIWRGARWLWATTTREVSALAQDVEVAWNRVQDARREDRAARAAEKQRRRSELLEADQARVSRARQQSDYDYHCPRCGGTGHLPEYSHVAGGVCFRCNGSG